MNGHHIKQIADSITVTELFYYKRPTLYKADTSTKRTHFLHELCPLYRDSTVYIVSRINVINILKYAVNVVSWYAFYDFFNFATACHYTTLIVHNYPTVICTFLKF